VATDQSEEFCGSEASGAIQASAPDGHHTKVDEEIPGILLGSAILWVGF